MSEPSLRSEVQFTLPIGLADGSGTLQRTGTMRLATARDELFAPSDPRVKRDPSTLMLVLLSKVTTQLGTLADVEIGDIESLYVADLRYLEEMYNRLNGPEPDVAMQCPHCGHAFAADFAQLKPLAPGRTSAGEVLVEHAFELPKGFVDRTGAVHRKGIMSLARARDEMIAPKDPRVRRHPSYVLAVLLARVVEELGEIDPITTGTVERMYAADLRHLEDLYRRINGELLEFEVECVACKQTFDLEMRPSGES